MNILIVGAGAIGGWLAGALAQAGASVSLLARGAALDSIRANGLLIQDGDERRSYAIAAAGRVNELPAPDVIVLTVKNFDFPSAVEAIAPALRPGVAVVTAMNGIPWWFLNGVDGPLKDARLETVDPGGRAAVPFRNIRRPLPETSQGGGPDAGFVPVRPVPLADGVKEP